VRIVLTQQLRQRKRDGARVVTHRETVGGVWTTPEMSGQGLHHGYWDSKGMYEDENIVVI